MRISLIEYREQWLILFQFPFNPGLSVQVQELPRAQWYPPLAGWGVPFSPLAAHLCLLFFSDLSYYDSETHRLLGQSAFLPPQTATPALHQSLHSFQAQGVAYLHQRNAIENSCPGSGKTRVALCAMESVLRTSCGNALIICPTSVVGHWESELGALFPARSMEILRGKQSPSPARDVVLCTPYTLVHKCRDLCSIQWDCVIVDEIHEYRNPTSRKTRALVAVTSRAAQVIGITGTLIVNRVRDLFGPLAAIKQVNQDDLHFFETRYCGKSQATRTSQKYQKIADGFTNENELRGFLPSCVLHRTREDLGRELPPLSRSVVSVCLNNLSRYQEVETLTAAWLNANMSSAPPETQMIKTNKLRRLGAIGKVPAAIKIIREYLNQGISVVIGCSFLEPLRLLERQFSSESVRIDGGVSRKERARRVLYFRESGKPLVALCSTLAAGIGITLTKAQVVLILDLPWSPIFLEQMEARIWREGQTAPCQAIYLLGQDTTDSFMLGVLRRKSKYLERLFMANNAPFVDPLSDLVRELCQGKSDSCKAGATGVGTESAFSFSTVINGATGEVA